MKKTFVILALLFIFSAIAIVFSYPLILHFNSSLPYTHAPAKGFSMGNFMQGDHLALYYIYWLIKDYFVTPAQNLFSDPYMFSLIGYPRPFEPRGLPSSILFLIFSIFGNIPAYNCVIMISFILAGICMFLLAEKYLQNKIAALAAGIIFAVSPFRLSQLFGAHPTGFILFWIPLIIYLYEQLWEKRKWIYGWMAAISIFLMCMEEHHMGYYTALFTIIFWPYKLLFCKKKPKLNIIQFCGLIIPIAAGWVASLSYMLYVKSIVINASVAGGGRTFDEIKLYAPILKNIFQRTNTDSEKYIYISIATSILILIGLFSKLLSVTKKNGDKNIFPYLFYLLTFIFSLLLCLGPNLTYIPLYKVCYKIIPFFYFPRSPARIYMYTLLALSLLSGYGVKAISNFVKNNTLRYSVLCMVMLSICVDFHAYPKIGLCTLPKGNKTYLSVKSSFPTSPLLEIPIWPGESSWTSVYQYYTTIYRISLINGYSPFVTKDYVDKIFWPLVSINMGMINAGQYELLKKLDVKYINLHEEAYPQKVNPFPFKIALENLTRSPYLKFMLQDGPVYLFQVLDKPLDTPPSKYTVPSKTGIFCECEYMPHRIGKPIEDKNASGNMSLHYSSASDTQSQIINKEPQHLVFGPWQLFPPGKYKVLFRLKTERQNSTDKIAAIEVTTNNGNKQIIYKDIAANEVSASYNDYILHFTLDTLTVLEFRVICYGKCSIWADYVYLLCEEENDPVWGYKATDLFHIGRESDGAVYATPLLDPPGKLIFGPYRRYPEGKYKVSFKLKAGVESQEVGAILKVTNGYIEIPLVEQALQNISTEYKEYPLEIHLDKPSILEFQVEFTKKIPLYVDSVKIEPISSSQEAQPPNK